MANFELATIPTSQSTVFGSVVKSRSSNMRSVSDLWSYLYPRSIKLNSKTSSKSGLSTATANVQPGKCRMRRARTQSASNIRSSRIVAVTRDGVHDIHFGERELGAFPPAIKNTRPTSSSSTNVQESQYPCEICCDVNSDRFSTAHNPLSCTTLAVSQDAASLRKPLSLCSLRPRRVKKGDARQDGPMQPRVNRISNFVSAEDNSKPHPERTEWLEEKSSYKGHPPAPHPAGQANRLSRPKYSIRTVLQCLRCFNPSSEISPIQDDTYFQRPEPKITSQFHPTVDFDETLDEADVIPTRYYGKAIEKLLGEPYTADPRTSLRHTATHSDEMDLRGPPYGLAATAAAKAEGEAPTDHNRSPRSSISSQASSVSTWNVAGIHQFSFSDPDGLWEADQDDRFIGPSSSTTTLQHSPPPSPIIFSQAPPSERLPNLGIPSITLHTTSTL